MPLSIVKATEEELASDAIIRIMKGLEKQMHIENPVCFKEWLDLAIVYKPHYDKEEQEIVDIAKFVYESKYHWNNANFEIFL